MNKKKSLNTVLRYASIVWIAIGILFGLLMLSEWYNVGVLGNTQGYFFGIERPYDKPAPYYYNSAELYARIVFLEGSVLLIVALMGMSLRILKKRKALTITLFIQLLVVVAMVLNGQIGR